MSYDLYFMPNDRLTREAFETYFSNRPWYEQEERQIWYGNEDTGVYFCFDWLDDEKDSENPDEASAAVSFNLNYIRPPFFGLEAEPEIRAFVNHFGLQVSDPQTHGMGDGLYSTEGFLRGWNHGNRIGIESVTREHGREQFHWLPEAELTRIWRWNLARRDLQDRLGESVFVPSIMLASAETGLQSFVAWIDAIPAAVPKVDAAIIPRQECAPRRFFVRRPDMVVAFWEAVVQGLPGFAHKGGDPEYWLLEYVGAPPPEVVNWVRGLSESADYLTRSAVPMDRVLPAELLRDVKGA